MKVNDDHLNYDLFVNSIPVSNITPNDLSLLNSCVWKNIKFFARMHSLTPFEINDSDHKVYFNIIYGYIPKDDKDLLLLFRKSFRYSELKTLFEYLDSKYNIEPYFPKFPKKHWFGNSAKKVINHRVKVFDIIFKTIPTLKLIDTDISLHNFFNIDLRQGKTSDDELEWQSVDVSSISDEPIEMDYSYIHKPSIIYAPQMQHSTFNPELYLVDESIELDQPNVISQTITNNDNSTVISETIVVTDNSVSTTQTVISETNSKKNKRKNKK